MSVTNFVLRSLLACLAPTLVAGAGVQPALAGGGDIEQLISIDKRMQRAFIDRDIATLEHIFTDDYILVVSSGAEYNKAQVIGDVASADVRWEINETSGWKVRVYGDTAVVVAILHQKGVDHGKPFDNTLKFSDTYVRVDGTWRNFHAHASRAVDVPKPAT